MKTADKISTALEELDIVFNSIKELADDIIEEPCGGIDELVKEIETNIDNLTNDNIREYLLRLSIKAFSLGAYKERASIKADCSEALRKEHYATEFTQIDGSVAFKESETTKKISEQIVAELLYDLVSNLLKVKLEEIRRLIDTLKTILMSRNSEAKLSVNVGAE